MYTASPSMLIPVVVMGTLVEMVALVELIVSEVAVVDITISE